MSLIKRTAIIGSQTLVEFEPSIHRIEGVVYAPLGLHDMQWRIYDQGRKFFLPAGTSRGPDVIAPGTILVMPRSYDTITNVAPNANYVYAGWLHGHYGHFLLSSLSRFWATASFADRNTKTLHHGSETAEQLFETPFFSAIFSALNIGVDRLVSFSEPTMVGLTGSAMHTSIFTPGRSIIGICYTNSVSSSYHLLDKANGNDAHYYHPHEDIDRESATAEFQLNNRLKNPRKTAGELLRIIETLVKRRQSLDEQSAGHHGALSDRRGNLAFGKPSRQSSFGPSGWATTPAGRLSTATNGILTGRCQFHTDHQEQPWWIVDLGNTAQVDSVIFHNRADGSSDRCSGFSLSTSINDIKRTVIHNQGFRYISITALLETLSLSVWNRLSSHLIFASSCLGRTSYLRIRSKSSEISHRTQAYQLLERSRHSKGRQSSDKPFKNLAGYGIFAHSWLVNEGSPSVLRYLFRRKSRPVRPQGLEGFRPKADQPFGAFAAIEGRK